MATNPPLSAPEDILLEDLPQSFVETVEERNAVIARLPRRSNGEEFLVDHLQRWRPGQVVRVAFYGGDTQLHKDIADATRQITDACNLKFDFGWNTQKAAYRMWSPEDTSYAAEIRVSFDQGGYWSLVGTDSVDQAIGRPGDAVGGRPNQRSLNLSRFDTARPQDWIGTTRHEFMHAIAFHHEHQNLNGPCQQEFRWEDDAGYVPTTTGPGGSYRPDAVGRRPGIYTYLSDPPNRWSKQKVDHNLRAHAADGNTAGVFDAKSVMLYRFPPLFYKTPNSPCAPAGDGQALSPGDIEGLQFLYPGTPGAAQADMDRRMEFVKALTEPAEAQALGLESAAATELDKQRRRLAASINRFLAQD
jgi:hypothetical protein